MSSTPGGIASDPFGDRGLEGKRAGVLIDAPASPAAGTPSGEIVGTVWGNGSGINRGPGPPIPLSRIASPAPGFPPSGFAPDPGAGPSRDSWRAGT